MPIQTIPERKEIAAEKQWDLTPLMPSNSDWEALFQEIENQLDTYETYKGRLGESAAVLKQAQNGENYRTRVIRRAKPGLKVKKFLAIGWNFGKIGN